MATPKPQNIVIKQTSAGVVWSCKGCGKGSATSGEQRARTQFAKHDCNAS